MYIHGFLRPCAGYGWTGGAEFQTRIVEMANGRERRNANWSQPRHRYNAPFLNISKEAYNQLYSMFMVAHAQVHAFLFRDELTNVAVNELFGVGDGVRVEWPLTMLFTEDGRNFQREVYALYSPLPNGDAQAETPVITKDFTPTAAFTVDHERGKVIFDVAPTAGQVLRWSGSFAIWVRFAQDYLPFSLDNINATNGSIDVVEVPPPDEEVS